MPRFRRARSANGVVRALGQVLASLPDRCARPAGGGADAGDRRVQGVLTEVVGLPPGDLIKKRQIRCSGLRASSGVLIAERITAPTTEEPAFMLYGSFQPPQPRRPRLFGRHSAAPGNTSPYLSWGLWLPLADVVAGFWTWILGPGYDGGPAVGPGVRGFHGPQEFPSFLTDRFSCWSGGVRDGLDVPPGGRDLF